MSITHLSHTLNQARSVNHTRQTRSAAAWHHWAFWVWNHKSQISESSADFCTTPTSALLTWLHKILQQKASGAGASFLLDALTSTRFPNQWKAHYFSQKMGVFITLNNSSSFKMIIPCGPLTRVKFFEPMNDRKKNSYQNGKGTFWREIGGNNRLTDYLLEVE